MPRKSQSAKAGAGFDLCEQCGGMHYGSFKCPYLKPCSVCAGDTLMACADCAIDAGGEATVYVCTRSECRDQHEAKTHANVPYKGP